MASGRASGRAAKDKCGTCEAKVQEKGLWCEICEYWFHVDCEGVPEDTYKVLQKNEDGVHWYCKGCGKGAVRVFAAVARMSKRQDKLDEAISSLNAKVGEALGKAETLKGEMTSISNKQEKLEESISKKQEKLEESFVNVSAKMEEVLGKSDSLRGEIAKLALDIENHKKNFGQALNNIEQKQAFLKGRIEKNELQIVNREEIESLTKSCISDGTWADVVKRQVDGRMENVEAELSGVQKVLDERKKELDNEKEREERKYGVVLYNVPEVEDAKNFNEQVDADFKFTCEIMSYIIDEKFENSEIKKMLRLGKRQYRQQEDETELGSESESNPVQVPCRPLLVVFTDCATKNYIMNNLFRLRRAEERFKKVIINHDMTAMDRAEIKELVNEAKLRAENDKSGEYIYRVRGQPGHLRIVKFKKRRAN